MEKLTTPSLLCFIVHCRDAEALDNDLAVHVPGMDSHLLLDPADGEDFCGLGPGLDAVWAGDEVQVYE